jgi:uncharacterized membrane protein
MTHITEDFVGENVNTWHGGYNYSLSHIIHNPVETMVIFARTLFLKADFYFGTMFGSELAGLTIDLPWWILYVTVLLIFAAVLYGHRDEWQPSTKERIFYLLICTVVVLLSMLAAMVGWTAVWLNRIVGVQGRYFIPILPLALMIFRIKKIFIPYESFRNAVIGVFLFMQGAAILFLLDYTISQY